MEKKIGICIAGYGNFGRKLHSYLAKMDTCEVRYLYHPDGAKAGSYGPLGTSDLNKVLADKVINAFVVATPNDRRLDILRPILEAGRHHVFVEKPMANSLSEAVVIGELHGRHEKVFMVGHCQRREAAYRKAKELLGRGAVGNVVNVNFNFSHGGAFSIAKTNWRANAARNDLGPLAMLGSHCIDTIHYLFGEATVVHAMLQNLTGKTEAPDCASVVLRLSNKATVFLQCNYNVPSEKYCFISGTTGAIYIDDGRLWLRAGRDQMNPDRKFVRSKKQKVAISKTDPIEEELKEFLNAIQTGSKVETGYLEGLAVMQVLEVCRQDVTEIKTIRLP